MRQPLNDYYPIDVTQDGQNIRADRTSQENDTYMLIVEAAERLFREIGFQKTTVTDISRDLHMSPANFYRYFAAKADINEAVCRDLLGKIEAEAERIAGSHDTAAQRLRNLIGTAETIHLKQYVLDRKLYDLVEMSLVKKWVSGLRHTERMVEILEQIIASGIVSGEFSTRDVRSTARLVNSACLRFMDPRLIVEYEQEPEPTLDKMISFCLAAMAPGANA
jgi:AcrR family transcriptional regulator